MTNNQIRAAELKETIRHNTMMEGAEAGKLAETTRSNQAQEGLKRQANDNDRRFKDSTTAVNWFNAQSLDSLNKMKEREAISKEIKNKAEAGRAEADTKLINTKANEIVVDSKRKTYKNNVDVDYLAKKALNESRNFWMGIGGTIAKVIR